MNLSKNNSTRVHRVAASALQYKILEDNNNHQWGENVLIETQNAQHTKIYLKSRSFSQNEDKNVTLIFSYFESQVRENKT